MQSVEAEELDRRVAEAWDVSRRPSEATTWKQWDAGGWKERITMFAAALLRSPAQRGKGAEDHYRSALEAIRGDDGACARWLAAHGTDSQSAGDLARQEYERGAGPIGTLQARYAELLDHAIAYRTVALVALASPPAGHAEVRDG